MNLNPLDTNHEFSVSEYLDIINEILKPVKFFVVGEVSSVTKRGGTIFFSVKDSKADATLECVIWKSVYDRLGIDLEEGMEVKMHGAPNIYKPRGKFTYVASSITPVGEGALAKAFEKLKAKLAELGYFDEKNKQPIPKYIKNVALITAQGSDAKKDFETHLGMFGYKIYFYDVRVEGARSIDNIIDAFEYFNSHPKNIDVIVLTRGGGSLESLQAFNSEGVAKAIFASKIPVICGIGHENDVTIADLVADLRASTPTHAGRIISEPWNQINELLNLYSKNFVSYVEYTHNEKVRVLEYLEENIILGFKGALQQNYKKLENMQKLMVFSVKSIFDDFKQIQAKFEKNINLVQNMILNKNRQILEFSQNFIKTYENFINVQKLVLQKNSQLLQANSPINKFKQGYSVAVGSNGKIIKSVKNLKAGELIKTRFEDGATEAKVLKITKE